MFVYRTCPLKVTSAEEDFNNKVCPVLGIPVSLSLHSLLLSSSGLRNGMAMVTELEVMRGLSHQAGLATITTKCPISSVSSGDQHRVPRMVPLPRVNSQLPGGRLVTLGHFCHGKGSILFLLEQTLTLDIDLPSLHSVLQPKRPECLSHHCRNSTLHCFWSRNSLQSERNGVMGM